VNYVKHTEMHLAERYIANKCWKLHYHNSAFQQQHQQDLSDCFKPLK